MNVSEVLKHAAGYWAAFLLLFLLTFPWLAPMLLDGLEFVLSGLTHFGEGWR